MKGTKKIFGLISAVIMLVMAAAGCGFDNRVTLNIYNWGDYIEKSVLKEFEKEYKIKVNYETFTTNEDMYVKINSGGSSYDIDIPSDYMISRTF